jgi:uncharacterized repeat protein (TIGR03806 family)
LSAGCATDSGADAAVPKVGPPAQAYEQAPSTLEGWNLFEDTKTQQPGARTLPYDVIAPLFSDYASKQRFVYVPEGKTIGYDPQGLWKFPTGSVLIKTFSYPADQRDPASPKRLLETRLLVFNDAGVEPHTYVWDEAQQHNALKVAGATLQVSWIHVDGAQRTNDYRVPNTNDCFECHGKREVANTLGLHTRQIDRDFDYGDGAENQIDHMQQLQLFDRAPEPHADRERLVDPFGDGPLNDRARSYLDANCSQCHRQGGDASASGMWLEWQHTAPDQPPTQWGVCKRPSSASGATCGHEVDILPGDPSHSIYMCRVESTDSRVQMPPLGRNLVHDEGVELLRAWIAGLELSCE